MVVKTLSRIGMAILVATIVVFATVLTQRVAHAMVLAGIARTLRTNRVTLHKLSWCANFGMALAAPVSTLSVGLSLCAVQLCSTGAGSLVFSGRFLGRIWSRFTRMFRKAEAKKA